MSVKLMGAVFELDLPPMEKLVLLAMADHAQDDGTGCYASMGRLARKSSMSRRGVQKVVRRLEHERELIVPCGISHGGRGRTTEYRIVLGKGEPGSQFDTDKGERGSQFSDAKGRTGSPKRANVVTQKGERGSPEPSVTVFNRRRNCAADSPNPWKLLGSDLPMGSLGFQKLFEHYAATRNGNPLSETMERTIQTANQRRVKVPPPFFEAKRRVERHEVEELAAPTGSEIPELEAEPWAK